MLGRKVVCVDNSASVMFYFSGADNDERRKSEDKYQRESLLDQIEIYLWRHALLE